MDYHLFYQGCSIKEFQWLWLPGMTYLPYKAFKQVFVCTLPLILAKDAINKTSLYAG